MKEEDKKRLRELFDEILSMRDPVYGAENKAWWNKLVAFIDDLLFVQEIDIGMNESIKRYNQAKEDGTLDKHYPTL